MKRQRGTDLGCATILIAIGAGVVLSLHRAVRRLLSLRGG